VRRKALLVEILAENHLEPELRQRCTHPPRIIHRIGEPIGMAIGAVADDERHALFRVSRRDAERNQQNENCEDDDALPADF
jgi:hypothetical protein